MNVIELIYFIGLPAIVAFAFVYPLPRPFALAVTIGLCGAVVSFLAVALFSFLYRLFRGRLPEKAAVPLWAVIAVLISATVSIYLRMHHNALHHPLNN